MTLTPVDAFEGDAAKLKLFLGPMTGAFTLGYTGSKPKADLDIDIWKNGRKADSAGSIEDVFYNPNPEKRKEAELIISVTTDTAPGDGRNMFGTIKICTIHDSGSSLATFTIPWEEKLTARGLMQGAGTSSFTDDQPVYVFGMQATSTNIIRTADLSPESLRNTEWALVFTLRFEE
ncbi:hypothetical protein I8J29_09905 [Paenibacillus sp. MWE-103]|uniref:Uncharacterized protein n=1 Tax=Paenibacillus artemisiicola TaxID=1172618 RepID=A0ABS3W866_9BACL|nr:hypothetical protein [Paenibacillus artemisiicola]MBO7744510.1 hypothetical protein [Paenibacillus artemisiicola]